MQEQEKSITVALGFWLGLMDLVEFRRRTGMEGVSI